MTEPATPQETSAADSPLPEGVIGVIPRAGVPAGAAGLVSQTGEAIRAKVDAEKAEAEAKAILTVTIQVFADGSRKVDTRTDGGKPAALGRVRELFKECKEHYDDRIMAHMVQAEVRRTIAQAARATKDRNLLARLFHALG